MEGEARCGASFVSESALLAGSIAALVEEAGELRQEVILTCGFLCPQVWIWKTVLVLIP